MQVRVKYVRISALVDEKEIKKTKRGAYYFINDKGKKVYVNESDIKKSKSAKKDTNTKFSQSKKPTPPPQPAHKKAKEYLDSLKKAPREVVNKVEEFGLDKKLSEHLKQKVVLSKDAIKQAAKLAAVDGMKKMWEFVKENPGVFLMVGSPATVRIPPGGRTRIHTWPGKEQAARNIDKRNLTILLEKESDEIANTVKNTVRKGIADILIRLFEPAS